MGVKFSKVLPLVVMQIVPPEQDKTPITKFQQKLLDKLGSNGYPFVFKFPDAAPSSVVLLSGDPNDNSKPLGVEYRVRAYVAESADDVGQKRSTVSLAVKKVRVKLATPFAPARNVGRLPKKFNSRSCNSPRSNDWNGFRARWRPKASHFRKVASIWR